MKRRHLLGVPLASFAAGAALVAGPRRAASAHAAAAQAIAVVQGAQALWAHDPAGAWQRLGGAAPRRWSATIGGLWMLTADDRLQHWQFDGRWAVRADRDVGPVAASAHALVAGDGHVLVAHGRQLALYDDRGGLLRTHGGMEPSSRGPAAACLHLPHRRSFVVAWPEPGELWEIQLDRRAPPIHEGLVHDYRLGEGIETPGYLGVRRIPLARPLPELSFAAVQAAWVAGTVGDDVAIVHLDVRRRIVSLRLPGARPQGAWLGLAGALPRWWLPQGDAVQLVDPRRWTPEGRHAFDAPVQAVFAFGGGVCVWVGSGAGGRLLHQQAAGWQDVDGGEAPAFVRAAPSGRQLLVAGAHPASVRLLDDEGRVTRLPPLPEGGRLEGLAWVRSSV
ncbi:MAG: hypothetical protein KIT17_20585 [Rubrivivax sp.]|nr:hypothetical protein [Rubrivivax sp.]